MEYIDIKSKHKCIYTFIYLLIYSFGIYIYVYIYMYIYKERERDLSNIYIYIYILIDKHLDKWRSSWRPLWCSPCHSSWRASRSCGASRRTLLRTSFLFMGNTARLSGSFSGSCSRRLSGILSAICSVVLSGRTRTNLWMNI